MTDNDLLDKLSRGISEQQNQLAGIATLFGLDTWEDLPDVAPHGLLEAVEKAMSARELKSFLRGLRAGNVARGKYPDELPEFFSAGAHTFVVGKDRGLGWCSVCNKPFHNEIHGTSSHGFVRESEYQSGCAVCGCSSSHPMHNQPELSSTGQSSNGIFDVIDKAVSKFWGETVPAYSHLGSTIGGLPGNLVMQTGERIKLALQKASAEELDLREVKSSLNGR